MQFILQILDVENPSYIANYDYYRGPAPFSESEVVAIRDFVLSKNFAFHSIS